MGDNVQMAARSFNDSSEGHQMESRITALETHHVNIMASLERIETTLAENLVTHHEFWPVKTIVYVGAGTVMLAVLTAVIALVIRVS